MFPSLPAFLFGLINESKQNIDNLPGEDGARLISESFYNRINTVGLELTSRTLARMKEKAGIISV